MFAKDVRFTHDFIKAKQVRDDWSHLSSQIMLYVLGRTPFGRVEPVNSPVTTQITPPPSHNTYEP